MLSFPTTRVAKPVAWLVLGVAACLALLGGRAVFQLGEQRAQAVPSPIYQIIAKSGSFEASLLNLKMGNPGVPQVPMPVDVDGDNLPDVTVAVNIVNVPGALQNPPVPGDVLAPNIEITRLATAPVLNQASPPLSIEVKLTIKDVVLNGDEPKPDTVVRFGYRTPAGGSIPQNFQAVLYGLEDFFQPLEAVVRTDGLPGDRLTVNSFDDKGSHYAGPLDLIGFIDHTADGDRFTADLGLSYDPWPEAVAVRFAKDDTGDHITYRHGRAVSDAIASARRRPRRRRPRRHCGDYPRRRGDRPASAG